MKSALISSALFLAAAGSAFAAGNANNNTDSSNNIGSNMGNGVGNGVGNGGVGNGVGNGNLTISAAAVGVWEGYATITASSPQCSGAGGTNPGDTLVSIYRPQIASTDTPTYLSFVFLRAAFTQENSSESTVPQMNGSGNYTGFEVGSHALFSQYTGTYNLTVTPPIVTASTPSVTIDGTITNFFNTTGCNVTFEGVYVERID